MAPQYCEVCQSINFLALPPFPSHCDSKPPTLNRLALYKFSVTPTQTPLGTPYHTSESTLPATHCELCRLLSFALTAARSTYLRLVDTVKYRMLERLGAPEGPYFLCARLHSQRAVQTGLFVLSQTSDANFFYVVGAAGYALPDNHDPTSKHQPRVRTFYPKNAMTFIKDQIEECKRSHQHQHGKLPSRRYPKRLIDVYVENTSSDVVKLVDSDSIRGQAYACLSHKWGDNPGLRTTNGTVAKRYAGIKLADLPATFEDAITITRDLNMKYLWIDSLCIIQDNDEDKAGEIGKMAAIYENADITFAASCAEQDTDGFLVARTLRRWSFVRGPASDTEAWALEIPIDTALQPFDHFTMPNEPLTKRGWTLQERCLSIRTIHFGTDQVSFECPRKLINEDRFQLDNPPFHFQSQTQSSEPQSANGDRFQNWRQLIESYTRRILTNKDDKLRAVAAMAEAYKNYYLSADSAANSHGFGARHAQPEYLAGVWRADVPRELCWRAAWGYSTRSEPYRAPSWSWASVDSPINFSPILNQPLASLTGAYITCRDDSDFERVKAGWIELSAPSLELEVERVDRHGNLGWRLKGNRSYLEVDVCWDCEGEKEWLTKDAHAHQLIQDARARQPIRDAQARQLRAIGLYTFGSSGTDSGGEAGAVVLLLGTPPEKIKEVNNLNKKDAGVWTRVGLLTISDNSEANSEAVRKLRDRNTESTKFVIF